MSAFGTATPTLEQRTNHFFQLWRDWRPHSVALKTDHGTSEVRHLLIDLGLTEFEDFQIRFKQVRFSDQTNLALAAMGPLSGMIQHGVGESSDA